MKPSRYLLAAVMLLAWTPWSCPAETVVEYGLGATSLHFPHYPGSEQSHTFALPFPYLTVRSERLEIDDNEMRGVLAGRGVVSLELSAGGALPVDASDNRAREDMPDLSWLGEIGPALRFAPVDQSDGAWRYALELPLRRVFELDGTNISTTGWTLSPNIQARRELASARDNWEIHLRLSTRFGTSRYHEHFYGVPDELATDDRPAYRARGGFINYQASMGLSWRRNNWWAGGFVNHSSFRGSKSADSPLMTTDSHYSAGIAVARIIGRREF